MKAIEGLAIISLIGETESSFINMMQSQKEMEKNIKKILSLLKENEIPTEVTRSVQETLRNIKDLQSDSIKTNKIYNEFKTKVMDVIKSQEYAYHESYY